MSAVIFRVGGGLVAISEPGMNAILSVMHACNAISHYRATFLVDKFVDLQVGAPRIAGDVRCSDDGRLEFSVNSRVIYSERDASHRVGAPQSVVTDVNVLGFAEAPGGNLYDDTALISVPVSWTPTQPDNIAVLGPYADGERIAVRLNGLVQELGSGRYTLPRGSTQHTGNVLPRWIRSGSGSINSKLTKALGGDDREASAGQDWAVLIPAKKIIRDIRRAMRAEFGGTPPGPGSSAMPVVTVSDRRTASLDEPLELISMNRMELRFGPGYVEYELHLEQTRPPGSPGGRRQTKLESRVILGGNLGEQESLSEDRSSVQSLQNRIDRLIHAVMLRTPAEGVVLEGMSTLARLLTADNVPDLFAPSSRSVDEMGLLITGGVQADSVLKDPEVSFSFGPTNDPQELWFHAGQSWCPGGTIVRYEWDFGDGAVSDESETLGTFVERHRYERPGDYTVSLSVTGEDGRQATASRSVSVGVVDIEFHWTGRNRSVIEVAVYSQGAPLEGAEVSVEGQVGITAADGTARLSSSGTDGDLAVEVRCGRLSTIRTMRVG